ncbi:MAG: M24 family metallopeptidase [Vicinamibacteria bacterium]
MSVLWKRRWKTLSSGGVASVLPSPPSSSRGRTPCGHGGSWLRITTGAQSHLRDGELVIFDVGTELDYYVADVGRTFPVSGKFTEEQKRTLDMVTAVSDAIIAAVRPG